MIIFRKIHCIMIYMPLSDLLQVAHNNSGEVQYGIWIVGHIFRDYYDCLRLKQMSSIHTSCMSTGLTNGFENTVSFCDGGCWRFFLLKSEDPAWVLHVGSSFLSCSLFSGLAGLIRDTMTSAPLTKWGIAHLPILVACLLLMPCIISALFFLLSSIFLCNSPLLLFGCPGSLCLFYYPPSFPLTCLLMCT